MTRKAGIPDPLSEISASIVTILEAHRTSHSPDGPFLTWSQIVASLGGVPVDWANAALLKPPARGQVLVAVPDDLKSPVALQADADRLMSDPAVLLRLVQHPQTGCSAGSPVRGLPDLCRSAEKSIRGRIESHWMSDSASLPSGLQRIRETAGKKTTVAIHDERFPRAEIVLSRKLVEILSQFRSAGESHYPAQFSEIFAKADKPGDDPILQSALSQSAFLETTLVVAGRSPGGWVAFRDDADSAVSTEGFLKRLLSVHCNEAQPEHRLSALARLLPRELQPRFQEVWRTHFDLQRRFPFMEMSTVGSKDRADLVLRDARFPRPERLLSEKLVRLLESQRAEGNAPVSWSELAELAIGTDDRSLLQKAIADEPFVSRVIVAVPSSPDSPVSLAEDLGDLATSSRLLQVVQTLNVTDENQAVPIEKLATFKGLHPLVRPAFEAALMKAVQDRLLPAGVGAVRIGGRWHLFRTQDAIVGQTAAVSPPVAPTKPRGKRTASVGELKVRESA